MSSAKSIKGAVFSGIAGVESVLNRSGAEPLSRMRNILLLQYPMALGTALHATPMVPALREAMPECRICVAASGMALEVFRNNPGVDYLIETPSPLRDLRGAARSLRQQNPFRGERFMVLTTVGNERTRVGLLGLASGASARVGFTEVPQLYRAALTFDRQQSLIANNLRLVGALGHAVRSFEPEMFPSDGDKVWAKQTLAASGVREGQMTVVFVTQTSPTQRKGWRAERFQATAKFLIEEYGAHILFVGTAGEAEAIDRLRQGIASPAATTSVAGKTTLPRLAALLSLCRVGLTLDTGTLHIGRTVGLPMVVIAPAWSPPLEWLPVNNPRYRILKNEDLPTCPTDYVIDEVSVDEVTQELRGLIEAFPAGARGANGG